MSKEMPCCRCNRCGCCVNCACVKANKPCQGCFPSRLDQCLNPITTAPTTISTEPLFFTPQCEITSSEILTPLDTIHDDNLNQPHPLPRFMAISAPNFYWGGGEMANP